MAGFLDFVSNVGDYVPGGAAAIPSWLAALTTKKPDIGGANALYSQVGQSAIDANRFANENADFYNNNYRPAAVAFNQRAQGVGGTADLNEAADRGAANFQGAFTAARANATRDMAGVNPNSGAAQARLGAIDASYAPGVVDAMNKARFGREQYGDTLRAQAAPMLATTPNFGTGISGLAIAGAGSLNASKMQNDMYRQAVGDTTKTFKLPGDLADNQARQKTNADDTGGVLGAIKQRFPSSAPDYGQFGDGANDYAG